MRERGRGVLVIPSDAVGRLSASRRAMYRRMVAASGCDEHDVFELRVSERGVEVDVVDFDDIDWPIRTLMI